MPVSHAQRAKHYVVLPFYYLNWIPPATTLAMNFTFQTSHFQRSFSRTRKAPSHCLLQSHILVNSVKIRYADCHLVRQLILSNCSHHAKVNPCRVATEKPRHPGDLGRGKSCGVHLVCRAFFMLRSYCQLTVWEEKWLILIQKGNQEAPEGTLTRWLCVWDPAATAARGC